MLNTKARAESLRFPVGWCACILPLVLVVAGCGERGSDAESIGGKITVFCAGSLARPLNAVKERYEATYPTRTISIEPTGSRVALRKWIELGRHVDVVALADRHLITAEAMPEHADWCVGFAGNRMVIAFTERARFASELSTENWMDVLSRPGVLVGRSDPNKDPCGYRALMVLKLADMHYPRDAGGGQIEKRVLANSPPRCVRPMEIELTALLESKHIDYAIIYLSCAVQHNLRYVTLPTEIDLSDPAKDAFYRKARVEVTGKRAGETVEYLGRSIAYGVTIPTGARRRAAAKEFVAFLLGPRGREAFEANGQPFFTQLEVTGDLPDRLKNLTEPHKD